MAKDDPPAVQWYPRDFAAAMYRIGATDDFELAYRRALDASFEDGAFGIGTPDDWCTWGRVRAESREAFLTSLRKLCVTCPDGTIAQVRMARDRMETVLYRRASAAGGKATAASMTPTERSERSRKAAHARWDANECLPLPSDANTASASASAPSTASALESKTPPGATHPAPKGAAFVSPTLEEVTAYCAERFAAGRPRVDPQAWFDHYTANGWKVGRNPMKNWRAAVRTWEQGQYGGNGQPSASSGKMSARQIREFRLRQEGQP